MSKEKVQGQTDQTVTGKKTVISPQIVRRKLLKSTVAIPVIMTLHSGAALARSSNLVGPVQAGDAVKFNTGTQEQLVCVNQGDGPLDGGPTYDLGEAPVADYAPLYDGSGTPLNLEGQATACQNGGGILISATAYTSLKGKGFLTNLPDL